MVWPELATPGAGILQCSPGLDAFPLGRIIPVVAIQHVREPILKKKQYIAGTVLPSFRFGSILPVSAARHNGQKIVPFLFQPHPRQIRSTNVFARLQPAI